VNFWKTEFFFLLATTLLRSDQLKFMARKISKSIFPRTPTYVSFPICASAELVYSAEKQRSLGTRNVFFSMLSLSTAILRAGCVASSGVSFIFDSFRNPLLRKFFSVPQRRYGPSSKMRSFFADCVSICPLGHREFMRLPFVSHNKTGMGRDYAFLR